MTSKQMVLVILIIAIALFSGAIFFIRKGISLGFKPVDEDKKKLCKTLRNNVVIFYSLSVGLILTMKGLELLVRSVDFSVETFNLLSILCISGALIMGTVSFICLWRWCRLRCKKSWPWLWGFILGGLSIFANIYLVIKVVRNTTFDERNLEKA